MRLKLLLAAGFVAAVVFATPVHAQTSYTLYEMLEPGSAKFKITYDVTTARAGSEYYLNPVRAGSIATDESVIDLSTGKELIFEVITGKQAKEQARQPAHAGRQPLHQGAPGGAGSRRR